MPATIVKIQKNKNITLPKWFMEQFHVHEGDFVRLEGTQNGAALKPRKLVDSTQAYFWTREWQEGEREAEEDILKGRVKKFKNVKALMRDLRR